VRQLSPAAVTAQSSVQYWLSNGNGIRPEKCTRANYLQRLSFGTTTTTNTTTTVFRPFFRDHTGEPVPEENFWTLWCKGRLTEADTPTIWMGATPSGLTSAHLHHPHIFTDRMPFLPPNQQCQSTEGNKEEKKSRGK